MAPPRNAPRSGFSILEVLVALLLFGAALQGVLAIHLASARGARRATNQQLLAARAASLADSLGALGCRGASGAATGGDGAITWTARHQPNGAVYDVVVSPTLGLPWRLEVAGGC
jgi:prepilin-type N-terminal cleavage/methylation domain-containing protein